MRPPHFRKLAGRRSANEAVPAASSAPGEEKDEQGEVVIYADQVFLGSSYPRRLRVVCFENPSGSSGGR